MAGINRHRTNAQILERNACGEKQCNKCWEWLSLGAFRPKYARPGVDGLDPICKSCDRFRKHGLTRQDVVGLLADQGSACGICNSIFLSFSDFEIDHDHACCDRNSCGKCVRGLLCKNCNFRVMALLDDTQLVERALFYAGRN